MRKPLKPNAAFSEAEKARITSACQRLIDDLLKPRFLPSVQPTQFNYPVGGLRRGGRVASFSNPSTPLAT
jgi:hypothetical protein